MGVIKVHAEPEVFVYKSSIAFPQYTSVDGTTGPRTSLRFDPTTEQTAFFGFRAVNLGTGGTAWTILLGWYANTATSGGVSWGVSISAQTANTDAVDVETKGFATETIITDTHLGTVAKRPHDVVGTLPNTDGAVADDWIVMRIARKPGDAGDTMTTGYAYLTMVDVSWSDT